MNRAVKIILASVAVVIALAAVTVKMIWFPTVKEAWFQVNPQRLRLVPAGTIVLRATHFPRNVTNAISYSNNGKGWMVGRNVTFQMLMAIAYSYNPGRIYLPAGTPKNNFDFVVTAMPAPEKLRAKIKRQTGFVAESETRETDVLALKVRELNSPGLKISDANEKQNANYKNGRLYFTHTKLANIIDGLSSVLKFPVVDKTALTNFYDFSFAWRPGMNPNNFNRDNIDKILADWGLDLEPDTASIEMLVVKKAN